MAIKIYIVALFILVCSVANSQDMTYGQFKYAILDYQPELTTWDKIKTDPAFKPSLVLAGTFAVNHMVTQSMLRNGNRQNITRPSTFIFIAGGMLSVAVYFIQDR